MANINSNTEIKIELTVGEINEIVVALNKYEELTGDARNYSMHVANAKVIGLQRYENEQRRLK